jgi:hypothetical protein
MSPFQALALPMTLFAFCLSTALMAGEEALKPVEEKYVIAIKTDDFELAETDVSGLATGESKTIVTDDGTTIDILRTQDGLEMYVDGVLAELNLNDLAAGDPTGLHKTIQVTCLDSGECEERMWISEDTSVELEYSDDGGEKQVITREIRIACDQEDECDQHKVWITNGGDEIHPEHGESELHIIRLHEGEADGSETSSAPRVIVIKEKTEID